MARFYRIQLDSIYLTKDGNENATPCKLAVTGVEALFQTLTGSVTLAADGTPIFQKFDFTKGKPLEIRIETVMQAVWEDLIALFNSALDTENAFEIVGTGDAGDFTADVLPALPNPYSFESFINGRIRNVVLRLITV